MCLCIFRNRILTRVRDCLVLFFPMLAAFHTPFLIAGLYTWTALDKLLPYMVTKEPRSLTLCVLAVNVLIVTPLHMCHWWCPGMSIIGIFPCMVMKEPGSLPLCVYYACLHGLARPTCHALDSTALMSPRGRNSLRGCLQLSAFYCFFISSFPQCSCMPSASARVCGAPLMQVDRGHACTHTSIHISMHAPTHICIDVSRYLDI